ncbi:hypothetical protein D3C76_1071630 [compost metagenome]
MNAAMKAKHASTRIAHTAIRSPLAGENTEMPFTIVRPKSSATASISPGSNARPRPLADAAASRKLSTMAVDHSTEYFMTARKKPITSTKRSSSPTISPKSACFITRGMKAQMNWIEASSQNSLIA